MVGLSLKLCCFGLLIGVVLASPFTKRMRNSPWMAPTNNQQSQGDEGNPNMASAVGQMMMQGGPNRLQRRQQHMQKDPRMRHPSMREDEREDPRQREEMRRDEEEEAEPNMMDQMLNKLLGGGEKAADSVKGLMENAEGILENVKNHMDNLMGDLKDLDADSMMEKMNEMKHQKGDHWKNMKDSWTKPVHKMMKDKPPHMLQNISKVAKHMMKEEQMMKKMYSMGRQGLGKMGAWGKHQEHASKMMMHMLKALVCKVDEMGARMMAMQAKQDFIYMRMKQMGGARPMGFRMRDKMRKWGSMDSEEREQMKKELEYMKDLRELKKMPVDGEYDDWDDIIGILDKKYSEEEMTDEGSDEEDEETETETEEEYEDEDEDGSSVAEPQDNDMSENMEEYPRDSNEMEPPMDSNEMEQPQDSNENMYGKPPYTNRHHPGPIDDHTDAPPQESEEYQGATIDDEGMPPPPPNMQNNKPIWMRGG